MRTSEYTIISQDDIAITIEFNDTLVRLLGEDIGFISFRKVENDCYACRCIYEKQ